MMRVTRNYLFRGLLLASIYSLGILSIVSSGGGGGGGGDETISTITINMSPLRVVGFSDDGPADPLHPIVYVGEIPNGEMLLMRVRDAYGMGDFYSILIRNGYGGGPAPETPPADEGEPDNSPIEAAILIWGTNLHRGLDPFFDEDWFSFTSGGECCNYVSTKSNASGMAADPILEIYNPIPNLGAVTYKHSSDGIGAETLISGTFDPTNNLTLIGMIQLWDVNIGDTIDRNSFLLVFAGPPVPGDYPIRFAAPPVPDDVPGSVTGSIHIDQYDDVDGRIIGSFDITIFDVSRSTTVAGSFNVNRIADEPGLLTGLKPSSIRTTVARRQNTLKGISAYMRGE